MMLSLFVDEKKRKAEEFDSFVRHLKGFLFSFTHVNQVHLLLVSVWRLQLSSTLQRLDPDSRWDAACLPSSGDDM